MRELAQQRPTARLQLATRQACLADPALRAAFALLVVEQGVANPQELLPCVRCGVATCGWCEACGPLWASELPAGHRRAAYPVCYTCDNEQRICPECQDTGFTWAGARREYQALYPEIYRFKVAGTWQAHVAEAERSWIRRQFGTTTWWTPDMTTPDVLTTPVRSNRGWDTPPAPDLLDEPDLSSSIGEAQDTTPTPRPGEQRGNFGSDIRSDGGQTPVDTSPAPEGSRRGFAIETLGEVESLGSPPAHASSTASTEHTLPARPAGWTANDVWL